MKTINTTDLIRGFAGEAGTRKPISFNRIAVFGAASALAIAVLMVLVFIGVRPEFLAYIESTPFLRKVASTLVLACGAFILLRQTARPGARLTPLALLPGAALFVCAGIADATEILGGTNRSTYLCIGSILMLSAPGLLLLLSVLRAGATTQPTTAGATAGLLAGALGATAYTLACKNDGGLFLLAWYPIAMLIVAGIGAAIGRRVLRW